MLAKGRKSWAEKELLVRLQGSRRMSRGCGMGGQRVRVWRKGIFSSSQNDSGRRDRGLGDCSLHTCPHSSKALLEPSGTQSRL